MTTRLHLDGDSLVVETIQDVEDIVEENKQRRSETHHGRDFRHKWNLPAVMVHKFYNEYAGTEGAPPPMNEEFWLWVDRKLDDPDYAEFRTSNKSNPFFVGFSK